MKKLGLVQNSITKQRNLKSYFQWCSYFFFFLVKAIPKKPNPSPKKIPPTN